MLLRLPVFKELSLFSMDLAHELYFFARVFFSVLASCLPGCTGFCLPEVSVF